MIALLPNQYEVSARLYVDSDAVLTPLLRGVAAETTATGELDNLQRTILSRPNLEKLISKTDLDLTLTSGADRDRLIQELGNDIKIKPQTKTLFTIEYRNTSAKLAYQVVDALLAIFVESASATNRADMENARRFLDRQIASYEAQLSAAEKRRAEFRLRYLSILPVEGQDGSFGLTRFDQVRENVAALAGQLEDAVGKREALKQELANTPAAITPEAAAATGAGGLSRLAQAEETLRDLRLRYTDDYPDVIAAKNLIASLKASPPPSGAVVGRRGGGRGQSISNPIYEQVKLRLVDADAAVLSLKRQLDGATKERDSLAALARQTPAVQAEYKALDRDYSVLNHDYQELLVRREAAQIAEAAETQADKVKLTVVDPPQVPRLPVSPNRVLLFPAVLLAGIGAGIGLTLLIGQSDRSFRTIEDLRGLGLPVLGGVSVLQSTFSPKRAMATIGFCAGILGLVMIFGGLLAYAIRTQPVV